MTSVEDERWIEKLWSCCAKNLPGDYHDRSNYANNRAQNSHQPTRRRERQMQRLKSPQ